MLLKKSLIDIHHRGPHETRGQNPRRSNLVDSICPYNQQRTDMDWGFSNSTTSYKQFEDAIGAFTEIQKVNLPFRRDSRNTVQAPMNENTYFAFIIPFG